jgi:SPP1 family predicted phage head-tail adaptor
VIALRIGTLRHRITIKQRQSIRNSYGESTESWVDVVTLWAAKEPLLGREYFAAEAAQSKVEVKFRTRYTPGVESSMRIQHGADQYEILGPPVDVQGLKRELLLYAKKVD